MKKTIILMMVMIVLATIANSEPECDDLCLLGLPIEETSFLPINYQTNKYDLGNGKFAQTSYLGFENYKDGNEFKPINMTLIDYGTYWKTTKSVYYPTIPKYADEWGEFNNVLEGNNHIIKVRPVAEHVEGIVNDNVVLYPDAFGEGFDLEVTAYKGHLLRKIIIREPQTDELYFDIEIDIDKKLDYESVDKDGVRNPIVYNENLKEKSIEFTEGNTPTILYPMKVWDSNGSVEYIGSKIYRQGNKLYFRKIISKEFLEKAVYPVYTDDDTGAKSPGTMANDNSIGMDAWDNRDEAKVEDNMYTITFGGKGEGTGVKDYAVKIIKSNEDYGAENKADTETFWTYPDPYTYVSYGGTEDLWSEIWSSSDINNANFGVVISAYAVNKDYISNYLKATNFDFALPGGSSINGILLEIDKYRYATAGMQARIDHIRITVYYEAPPPDTDPPTYTDNTSSTTTPATNDWVNMNVTWTDDNPALAWFGNNFTGTWINDTPRSYTSNLDIGNRTQVTASEGDIICWQGWANDTGSYVNETGVMCMTVAAPVDTCTYSSGTWNVDCSDDCEITSNVDLAGESLYLTGTGSFTVIGATIGNYRHVIIGDGTNHCRVKTIDGGRFVGIG